MGVPNLSYYRVTKHASKRYKSRIDPTTTTNTSIMKACRTLMMSAVLLHKHLDGTQVWLNEEKDIVLILDPAKYNIITVYKSYSEYNEILEEQNMVVKPKEKEEVRSEEIVENNASKVTAQLISNLVEENYLKVERGYYAKVLPLYQEYLERLDKTTRITRPDQYEASRKELKKLKKQITEIENEANIVTKELKQYIVAEED